MGAKTVIELTFEKFLEIESDIWMLQSYVESLDVLTDDQLYFMEQKSVTEQFMQREWAIKYLFDDLKAEVTNLISHIGDVKIERPETYQEGSREGLEKQV